MENKKMCYNISIGNKMKSREERAKELEKITEVFQKIGKLWDEADKWVKSDNE